MLKQYQLHGCPYALRTRIVLHEKGIPFETVQMDRANKPAEVLAVSPMGTSPVIFDGPVRLRSSPVINEYLEERYPEPHLLPVDAAGRAEARLLIEDVSDDLGEATGELVRLIFRTAPEQRDADELAAARTSFWDELQPFEDRLGTGSFLLGDAFSLVDAALFTQVRSGLRLLKEDLPATMPHLGAWKSRVEGRPAVAAALAEEPS